MRIITGKAAKALNEMENFTLSNTRVKCDEGLAEMYLFDNLIARYDEENHILQIFDGGYQSVTTKERLNGILTHFNMPYYVKQKNYVWYLVGENETIEFESGVKFSLDSMSIIS